MNANLTTQIFLFNSISIGDEVVFGTEAECSFDLCAHHDVEELEEIGELDEIKTLEEVAANANEIYAAAQRSGDNDINLDVNFDWTGDLESVTLDEVDVELKDVEIHYEEGNMVTVTVDGNLYLHNDAGSVKL